MPHFQFHPIRHTEYLKMKWKNGKGETSQIALFPKEALFPSEPFLWRLSSAKIQEDGPFSEFPGYERAIVLLEGAELKLSVNSEEHRVSKTSVFYFSGNQKVNAILNTGPVIDLNLIWNAKKLIGKMKAITLKEFDQETMEFNVNEKTQTLVFYFVKSAILVDENVHFYSQDSCVFTRKSKDGKTIKINFGDLSSENASSILFYSVELFALP